MRLLLFLLVVGLAMMIGAMFMNQFDSVVESVTPKVHQENNSKVLLEKIQKVYKMVVVEGEFADILDRKEYYGWDLPGLRKRALVKVKGKVSVGYDLENLRIEMDSASRTMRIMNLPEPEILSIDTDVNYYDIENGMFNSFTPQELSQLHAAAKDTIRANALRSKMMETARQQAGEMFGFITQLATESGWQVAYIKKETPAIKPSIETPAPTKPNTKTPTQTNPKPNTTKPQEGKKYTKQDIEALKKKQETAK